jgi:hypothetical protein
MLRAASLSWVSVGVVVAAAALLGAAVAFPPQPPTPLHTLRLLNDTVNALPVMSIVEVVLVGFDGTGRGGVVLDAPALASLLSQLLGHDEPRSEVYDADGFAVPPPTGSPTTAGTTAGGDDGDGGGGGGAHFGGGADAGGSKGGQRTLPPSVPVHVSTVYRVRHAARALAARVTAALNAAVVDRHNAFVPAEIVAGILADDYGTTRGFTLYLLNPGLPPVWRGAGEAAALRSPQYWYRHDGASSEHDPLPPDGCASSLWVSNVSRMAFYDLSAGACGRRSRGLAHGLCLPELMC